MLRHPLVWLAFLSEPSRRGYVPGFAADTPACREAACALPPYTGRSLLLGARRSLYVGKPRQGVSLAVPAHGR